MQARINKLLEELDEKRKKANGSVEYLALVDRTISLLKLQARIEESEL